MNALDEVEDLCPWCIADGSAASVLDAEFTDVDDAPSNVPEAVVDEIARRTPGFAGWQQEHWLYHCGDGAAFLGRVGRDGLEGVPPAVQEAIRGLSKTMRLEGLNAATSPTAYLFECLHCQQYECYIDFS